MKIHVVSVWSGTIARTVKERVFQSAFTASATPV